MNLAEFNTVEPSEQGRWFEPIGLDGELIGIRIKLHGPDSRAYAEARDLAQRAAYKRLAEKGKEQPKLDAAEMDSKNAAAITIDWEPIDPKNPIEWDGEPFPFTRANAEKLYSSVPIIRVQVLKWIEDRRNFTKPERQNSAKPSGRGSNSTGRAKKAAR